MGGAGLAASVIALGLMDEYHLFVNPIVVGGGTPFFPQLEAPIEEHPTPRRAWLIFALAVIAYAVAVFQRGPSSSAASTSIRSRTPSCGGGADAQCARANRSAGQPDGGPPYPAGGAPPALP